MSNITSLDEARKQAMLKAVDNTLREVGNQVLRAGFGEAAHFIECARQSLAEAAEGNDAQRG